MKRSDRKRVLVTGGAGFLGSHLCERLIERGEEVLCVDNFYTGDKDNVSHLLDHPHFGLIRHDITFPPVQRCADIGLAREKLDWMPSTRLRDGLVETTDCFRPFCETE